LLIRDSKLSTNKEKFIRLLRDIVIYIFFFFIVSCLTSPLRGILPSDILLKIAYFIAYILADLIIITLLEPIVELNICFSIGRIKKVLDIEIELEKGKNSAQMWLIITQYVNEKHPLYKIFRSTLEKTRVEFFIVTRGVEFEPSFPEASTLFEKTCNHKKCIHTFRVDDLSSPTGSSERELPLILIAPYSHDLIRWKNTVVDLKHNFTLLSEENRLMSSLKIFFIKCLTKIHYEKLIVNLRIKDR